MYKSAENNPDTPEGNIPEYRRKSTMHSLLLASKVKVSYMKR
jgi:hypothetical protein